MEKSEIIARLVKNSAEIITEAEFKERLEGSEQLTHYIGFEISGYVHLGTGLMSALVMKDLTDLGVKCTVWLADWHSWINDKLDGSKETAAKIGQGYFTEAMKASYMAVGGNPNDIEFRLASEWYAKDALHYMELEKAVEKATTLARMQRSISVAGKHEGENVDFATLTYPAMQVADIFYQEIAIAHAGMDQRKAHVIMRDVAEIVAPGKPKPLVLHHPLLLGLVRTIQREQMTPEENKQLDDAIEASKDSTKTDPNKFLQRMRDLLKMSKTNIGSALWVHDEPEIITKKITAAYCPPGDSKEGMEILVRDLNPVLNWTKNLLFWNRTAPLVVEREEKHGGNLEFEMYEELEKSYAAGDLHPMDLKAAVAKELIALLTPVREHFAKPEIAAMKAELDAVLAKK